MQPQADVRIGQILRLRYCADIEHQPVVGLGDAPDERHRLHDPCFIRRHSAQERYALLQQSGQPVESHTWISLQCRQRLASKVTLRFELRAFQPRVQRGDRWAIAV